MGGQLIVANQQALFKDNLLRSLFLDPSPERGEQATRKNGCSVTTVGHEASVVHDLQQNGHHTEVA